MASYIARASKDTLHQAGGIGGLSFLILSIVVGYFSLGPLFGQEQMTGAWPGIVSGFAGLGAAALLLFLCNLIAAPFRLERDRRLLSEERTAELEKILANRPNFEIRFRQIFFSAETTNDEGEELFENRTSVFVNVEVVNIGGSPSALTNWRMGAIANGVTRFVNASVLLPEQTVHIPAPNGYQEIKQEHLIYSRTVASISPGSIKEGFAWALFDAGTIDENVTVFAECEDIYRTVYRGEYLIEGSDGATFRPLLS